MKTCHFLLLAICSLLSFSSCSDKDSNDPEPETKKTFKGCRISRIISVATWDSTLVSETEYIYDAHNNIIEQKNYFKGNYASSNTYSYNAKGQLVGMEPYNHFYVYNAAGQLLKTGQYDIVFNVYHYNASGLVDSSWIDSFSDSVFKPNFLTTYSYDSFNRLKSSTQYSVTANGVIDLQSASTAYVLAYDNFKNPYALPRFTIGQTVPSFQRPKNNVLETSSEIYTYVYRPDSLVAEMIGKPKVGNSGGITKFVYDCN